MKGFIYKITNRVNNKVYIGQTRFTVEHRWNQHLRHFNKEHRQQPLYKAFQKYGTENFQIEALEEVELEKLDEREIYWIAKYDSFKNGYNATIGGKGGGVYVWTDNQYEEMRDLYLSGFTLVNLATKFNTSAETIRTTLLSLGVKLRNHPMDMNKIEREKVIEDYKQGCSLESIAKRFNTDAEVVKKFLRKYGVDIRQKSMLLQNEDLQSQMVEDFLNGMKLCYMEDKYHADNRTIKRILTIKGINFRQRRGLRQTNKGAFCLTNSECLECIRLYNSGMLMKDLAHKFNISMSTLYSLLDRYNIKRRYNSSKSVQVSE